MIVVVIMGILAGLSVGRFGTTKEQTYDAGMRSNLAHAMISIEDYRLQFDTLPPDAATFEAATHFQLTNGTVWDIFNPEMRAGMLSVEMQVSNPHSTHRWHAHYPADGKLIEQR
jgi:type II secretory pathway pseudopilin PulG